MYVEGRGSRPAVTNQKISPADDYRNAEQPHATDEKLSEYALNVKVLLATVIDTTARTPPPLSHPT
jgi:hypothetical protein